MKNITKVFIILIGSLVSLVSLANNGNDFENKLLDLQQEWANVNYVMEGDLQEDSFDELIIQAERLVNESPKRAESWIWQGIIQSSYAGAKGGFGALSLIKSAKKSFEKALVIDERASAFASLGILYHKAPGWPIAFGDDNDAQFFLKKAVEINPEGIDSNYFYGEFLYDEGNYDIANKYLHKAQNASARKNREMEDKYMQNDIQILLTRVEKKLASQKH